ncbi:hypothetical protein predicted by Glimmer/Critica [Acetobacter ghanensis]|uniref:Uncharacterized protein n=1 Tax=Acetobacter ghanensis TaxID=431306 RepID=A0A0U5F6U8_9PROT|nr:hypothetical protein predicted by Glimmer/Critica [Acetobacter ghanensis]
MGGPVLSSLPRSEKLSEIFQAIMPASPLCVAALFV